MAVCMAAALTACGGADSAGNAGMGESAVSGGMSSETAMTPSGEASADGEAAGSGTASPAPDGAGQLPQPYAKYMEILEMIRDEGRDPNGREYDSNADWNFENNCFAILDVDRDGRQELIFNFNESFMGAMCEVVYEYDEETDTLREELVEWVDTEYYSQGLVKVGCSHNHGRDPEGRGEWPYSVYEYDSEEDSYRRMYMMDPWDGRIHEEDFPDELDKDGDKLLYCITVENGRTAAGTAADEQVMIFDQEEYDAWEEELMPEWCRMDVTYHPMTEDAIENVRSAYTQAERLTNRGEVAELPLVRLCDSRERDWNSDFDIGGRIRVQAYHDGDGQEDEVYYYNMTLKADGTAEEITKEQYEAIREDYVRDMTEVRVYQNWTYFPWDEIARGDVSKDSEETICRKLFGSYLGSE